MATELQLAFAHYEDMVARHACGDRSVVAVSKARERIESLITWRSDAAMPAAPSDAEILAVLPPKSGIAPSNLEAVRQGLVGAFRPVWTEPAMLEFARAVIALSHTTQPQAEPLAPVPYDKHEAEILAVIDERDRYHDMADQLAAQIATITETDLGEHSSDNDPWRNAMLAADEWIARDLRAMFAGESEPRSRRAQAEPAAGEQAGAVNVQSLQAMATHWEEQAVEETATRRVDGHVMAAALRSCAMSLRNALAAPGAAIAAREQEGKAQAAVNAIAALAPELEDSIHGPRYRCWQCSHAWMASAPESHGMHCAYVIATSVPHTPLASREEAPATPQGETIISDAMVDAYLKAQRETVERVDREWGGKTGKAAEHLHPVREACRNGLRAALTQPTTVQQTEKGGA